MNNVVVKIKMSPTMAGRLYLENENNKERIKALELDLGLMTIARDQQAELRESCERALHKRDNT